MTVKQNLSLAMRFSSVSEKEQLARIESTLEEVNLPHLRDALVNTLSGGEQQRVALARTILKPGNLVLADEPTGSLDINAAENSFELIRKLCERHKKTVIMVTHNFELAQRTDRLINILELDKIT